MNEWLLIVFRLEKGTFGDKESDTVLNLVLLCRAIAVGHMLFEKMDE